MNKRIEKIILELGGNLPSDDVEMKLVNEEGTPLWCVYMHTSPSGKYYIGITSRDPIKRWCLTGSGYKKQKMFYDAIKCYGWKNFSHEILSYNLTEDIAKNIEIALIKELNTTNRDFGYNITQGGDSGTKGIPSVRRKQIICLNTLEIFPSITEAASHYKLSSSAINDNLIGRNSHGGKDSDGNKLLWEYYDPDKKYRKKKYKDRVYTQIICVSTLQIFDSISKALKNFNINREDLRRHLKGLSNYCGTDNNGNGLIWERYDSKKVYTKKVFSKDDMSLAKTDSNKGMRARPVICLFDLKVYSTAAEASRITGAHYSKICDVCNGRRHSAGLSNSGEPLVWAYYDSNKVYTKTLVDDKYRIKKKKVLCIELNKIYDCASSASKDLNIIKSTIYNACSKGECAFGYHFKYVE